MRRYFGRSGFSLYEVLIALAVIALVAVMAIPQVERASFRSKLAMEKANIALIQEAKEAYAADNPGMELTNSSALLAYLPDQQMPESPFGTEYKNLTDLSKPVTSGSSDVPVPQENNFVAIAKSEANGYNSIDGSSSTTPIIALNVPTPTPSTALPTPTLVPNTEPSVLFSATPSTVYRGELVTLRAGGSDVDDDPLSYNFTASGKSVYSGTDNTLGLNFQSLGIQPLGVMVSDGRGGAASASASVEVKNRFPTVSLSQSLTNTFRGNPVKFTATGLDGDNDPITYQFKINEDAPLQAGAGSVLDQSFNTLGKQKVSVAVNDGFGGLVTAQAEVNITNRPPDVSISGDRSRITRNQSVSFSALGKDLDLDPLEYQFVVEGNPLGFTSSGKFQKVFESSGNKIVGVQARDNYGGLSSVDYISVQVDPLMRTLTASVNPSVAATISGQGVYPENTKASLSIAYQHPGYSFVGWAGGWGNSNPLVVDMSLDRNVTAEFSLRTFKVSLWVTAYASAGHNVYSTASIYDTSTGQIFGSSTTQAYSGLGWSPVDSRKLMVLDIPYGTTIAYTGHSEAYIWSTWDRWIEEDYVTHSIFWGGQWYPQWAKRWIKTQESGWAGSPHYAGWDGNGWIQQGTKSIHSGLKVTTITGNTDLGSWGASTPLLLDLDFSGSPDLLSGGSWKTGDFRRPDPNPNNYREIDLDGRGKKYWEWVGPKDGLLLWIGDLNMSSPEVGLEVSGKNLFGVATWGKAWNHGFEPLRSLDQDGDGKLSGQELKDLAVWQDKNGDARLQVAAGELLSLEDLGIEGVSVAFTEEGGNYYNLGGTQSSGKAMAIWDWVSMSLPRIDQMTEVNRFNWTNELPDLGHIELDIPRTMEKLQMNSGGELILYTYNGNYYMRVLSFTGKGDKGLDLVFPAVVRDGVIEWGLPSGNLNNYLLPSGDSYVGLTHMGNKYAFWSVE